MTAQFRESLIYDGEQYSMCTEPLASFFVMGGIDPGFESNSTALWRGYMGCWEITDNRLYLISLVGTLSSGDSASIVTIFPGYPDRVFANWYSGFLRIPQGQQLEYVHMGYASTYERDLFLHIEKGTLLGSSERQNVSAEFD